MSNSRGVIFDLSSSFASVQHLSDLQDLFGATRFLQSILQLCGQQLTHWQSGGKTYHDKLYMYVCVGQDNGRTSENCVNISHSAVTQSDPNC